MKGVKNILLLIVCFYLPNISIAFSNIKQSISRQHPLFATDLTSEQELTLANIPPKFSPLFTQALKATIPRPGDNTKNAHDPFRFEWGTWYVMCLVNACSYTYVSIIIHSRENFLYFLNNQNAG